MDALAAAWLYADRSAGRWIVAGLIHVLAIALVWTFTRGPRSRRGLATALTATLPVLGPVAAIVDTLTQRRGEIIRDLPSATAEARPLTIADVCRLTDSASAFQALRSGSPAERDAMVAMLVRRGDSTAVTLLERAVAGDDPDLAVEAALALEDLSLQREAVTS